MLCALNSMTALMSCSHYENKPKHPSMSDERILAQILHNILDLIVVNLVDQHLQVARILQDVK